MGGRYTYGRRGYVRKVHVLGKGMGGRYTYEERVCKEGTHIRRGDGMKVHV